MITIPDRLLSEDFVTLFGRSADTTLLKKHINRSLPERASYVAQHVITMVVAGEQRIRAHDGETLTLRAGDMGAIRQGLYTVTDLVDDSDGFMAYLLFFGDERRARTFPLTAATDTPPGPFYRLTTPPYLPAFWQSVEALHASLPHHPSLSAIKVDEFFAVLKAGVAGPKLAERLAGWTTSHPRNIRQFMEAHYDKALTVEDYAYLTGRSESTFRRDFKARFGTTPRQWIIRRRLEKAQALLHDTDWDVTRIAEAVGYDNVSHFISAFKRQYQRTPRQKLTLEKSIDRKAAS